MELWILKTVGKIRAKATLGVWFGLMVLTAFIGGCADDTYGPEIAGSYDDNFGSAHVIAVTLWTQTFQGASPYIFHIKEYDNDSDYLLAQNDAGNGFSPVLFSRFDWTYSIFDLYYCQSVFDGSDLDEARAGSADRNDLAAGCGGSSSPWSKLVRQVINQVD